MRCFMLKDWLKFQKTILGLILLAVVMVPSLALAQSVSSYSPNQLAALSISLQSLNDLLAKFISIFYSPEQARAAQTIRHNYTIQSCYGGTNANNSCTSDADCSGGVCLNPVVAWWNLDEPSGTRAATGGSCGADCNLNDVNGVSNDNANKQEGNYSALFDSANNEYLQCSDATCNELDLSGNGSLGCWARATSDAATMRIMTNDSGNAGYHLKRVNNLDRARVIIGDGIDQVSVYSSNDSFPINTWKHIVTTIDDLTDAVSLYLDGSINNTGLQQGVALDTAVFTLSGGYFAEDWEGQLDECFVANQAYTNQQVCEICRFGLDGEESDRGALCGSCDPGPAVSPPSSDTTPPVLSNGSPSGTLSAGTTQTTMQVTTNENATCKYSTTANTSYSSMSSTFSTTGSTNHSSLITGLTNGQSYNYYVRCQDTSNNPNTSDYSISFSVASPPSSDTTPPTVSITTPANNSTVSGNTTITANASDNVGVAGVQFKLDESNLQSEDTSSPYSISWLTTTVSNAIHTLIAVARDIAGNLTTSSSISVTVNNQTTPPSEFSFPITDFVKTGILHWSAASGDTFNPDDSNDFDNSFGEHNGSINEYRAYLLSNEYLGVGQRLTDYVQFDMNTPTAGAYTFAISLGLSIGYPLRVSTCPNAGCPSNVWTDLTPDAIETEKTSLREREYRWDVLIPEGQTVTRFRIKPVAASGNRRVKWAVIKKQVENPFISPPTNGVHPRLMFNSTELAGLRAKVAVPGTTSNYLYNQLLIKADGFHSPNHENFNVLNNSYESHDFALILLDSSLAATLSEDPLRKARAIGYLQAIAELPENRSAYYDSSWIIDDVLEQSNILSSFAIAYDIMYNDLTPQQRIDFANKISFEADKLDTSIHSGYFWTFDGKSNNKRAINPSALGLSGLVLDNHITSEGYINTATDHMVGHLDTMFDSHGGYGESASYYTYANERFVQFASALRRAGGFDLFTYNNSVFEKTGRWLLDMMMPDTLSGAEMGDTNSNPLSAWSIATIMQEYKSGLMRWMFDYIYSNSSLLYDYVVNNWRSNSLFQTLLFYDESIAPITPEGVVPTSHIYDVPMAVSHGYAPGDSGFVFFRTSWANKDALYLATQCGDDASFHGHSDHGSIIFEAYQQRFVSDFGDTGGYGTASMIRHDADTGHNALFIDGKAERSEDSDSANLCNINTWVTPSFLSFVSMNPTAAYNYKNYNNVQYAKRHVMFVETAQDRGYVVLIDDVNKDGASHTYKQRFLGCGGSPVDCADSVTWSLVDAGHYKETGSNGAMDVFVAEPTTIIPTIATEYGANYIDLESTQNRGMYVTLLFPTSNRLGVTLPSVTTIRDAAMSGFFLNNDTILFNRVGELQTSSNVTFDGEVIFVRGITTAEKFLATKAKTFSYQGVQYFTAPQAPSSIAVEYAASGLTAELDMGTATSISLKLSLTPSQVLYNGQSVPFTYTGGMVTVNNLIGRGTLTIITGNAPPPAAFDFSLSNSGNLSVSQGSSGTSMITATLINGTPASLNFSASGLPTGASASFSPVSCSPNCSTTLTITATGSTPTGISTITVTATGGGTTKTTPFTLTVSDATPPTITFSSSSVTETSATIIWTTNEPATNQIEYGFTSAYGNLSPLTTSFATNHSITISSLSASTTYNYRIHAFDSVGNETIGINRSFTTLPSVITDTTPPSAITNLAASQISQTSADIPWTSTGDNGIEGTSASYDLRYSTSAITDANFSSATQATGLPTPKLAGSSEVYVLAGLSPSTTYFVAIQSTDSAGNTSFLSNVVTFTTLAVTQPPPPPVPPPVGGSGGGGGGGGGSGGGGGGYFDDITPPQTPKNATTTSLNNQITLRWKNPPDTDFVRVAIVKNTSSSPQSRTDGVLIYEGSKEEFHDIDLDNTKTYHYAIYAYDKKPNYSSPAMLSAQPQAGVETTSITVPFPPPFLQDQGKQPCIPQTIPGLPLTRSLAPGSTGADIKLLQQYLNTNGFIISP